ncbi:MAG TPA: hypothetical protein PLH94_12265 [Fimbriimonadaceae bacterium]|nr:hypothetical protein [Fimbriimonadaceae bacterium]
MMISSYPQAMATALQAIRRSQDQALRVTASLSAAGTGLDPDRMSELRMAQLAQKIAIRVVQQADTMMRSTIDVLA